MYRTHKLNELRLENVNESVTLSGWEWNYLRKQKN